jgi:hypothetical protein
MALFLSDQKKQDRHKEVLFAIFTAKDEKLPLEKKQF